jgi:hypothetical protein
VVSSCGSSNGSSNDAGGDISHKPVEVIIGDSGGDGSSASSAPADGTTGLPCKTDSDCAAPGGPGINICSNSGSLAASVTNVQVTLLPTPVCLVPLGNGLGGANCDPAPPTDPTGANFHFCDGPDSPNSPGICIPLTATPSAGLGLCQIPCTAALDGTVATGCLGQDTCILQYVGTDPTTNMPIALGYCRGSCEKDADCADLNTARAAAGPDAGPAWVCQVDIGYCTQHPVTRTKQLGAACVASGRGSDNTSGACNCALANAANKGFCTQACIVGGAVACPNGWECDDLQLATLSDGTTIPTETVNSPGFCIPRCSLDGGAGAPVDAGNQVPPEASTPADASIDGSTEGGAPTDASTPVEASSPADAGTVSSSMCPPNSTCRNVTPVGPNCQP